MATNTKVTLEDVKKAASEGAAIVKTAANAAKAAAVEESKKLSDESKKVVDSAKKTTDNAKKTAAKATTTAKKTATKAKATTTKAVKKVKKEVVKTATIQFAGKEYKIEEIMAIAEAAFKNEFKRKSIEEINIYVKPEEHKVYYVVNGDCVGSADL